MKFENKEKMIQFFQENLSKEIKSVVLPNQYIDPHQKNQRVNPDNHQSTLDKYNLEVTESLKRINDLIKKII